MTATAPRYCAWLAPYPRRLWTVTDMATGDLVRGPDGRALHLSDAKVGPWLARHQTPIPWSPEGAP